MEYRFNSKCVFTLDCSKFPKYYHTVQENIHVLNEMTYTSVEILSVQEAESWCHQQERNWSLPLPQDSETHQRLVSFMINHGMTSVWLGWKLIPLKNWTWVNSDLSMF